MPSLSIRNIDEETLYLLGIRAAKHGNSLEEEVHQILKRAVSTPERLGDLAVRLFNPAYVDDNLACPALDTHDPMSFSKL